jgi:hypothetical protein
MKKRYIVKKIRKPIKQIYRHTTVKQGRNKCRYLIYLLQRRLALLLHVGGRGIGKVQETG